MKIGRQRIAAVRALGVDALRGDLPLVCRSLRQRLLGGEVLVRKEYRGALVDRVEVSDAEVQLVCEQHMVTRP